MCEIQFVKWAIEIDERSDLPCINLYYTMDYDNKLWCHRFLFDELLIKDEEPNFRSIIYNLILDKEHTHTQCVFHIIRLRLIIFHTPKNFHGDFHFNFFL